MTTVLPDAPAPEAPQAVLQYGESPYLGPYFDFMPTPHQIGGRIMWISLTITSTRKSLAEARVAVLRAKRELEEQYEAVFAEARDRGDSLADAERTAKRLTKTERHAKEDAELRVTQLREELEELMSGQMPAIQSLNRIALAEAYAEGATGRLTP